MLDNKQIEPPKFRIRNWVEINDESPRTFKPSNQKKFEISMIRSNYSDVHILVSGTITIAGAGDADAAAKQADERD